MSFLKIITSLIFLCLIGTISSCNKSSLEKDLQSVFIKPASEESGISSEFIKFDNNSSNGRCADFRLINKTDYRIMCVRGNIIGYNKSNEKIYEFPWSQGRLPAVAQPQKNAIIEDAGFNIPKEVIKIEYILEEFDLIE